MHQKKERLQKIISACGITSRREAEKIIAEGRVKINGVTATLGQSAQLGTDTITVDGTVLTDTGKSIYIMLNKPCGYITTVKDQRGRKTVMELVSDAEQRVFPVGRLDLDSEGLLLFTNDGDFANRVMHPSYSINKTYEADVIGDAAKAAKLMKKPLKIDGHTVQAHSVRQINETKTGGTLEIIIAEGRNRQVRKMCNICGVKVSVLRRISIGTINLGGLKPGHWRHLTDDEVNSIGKRHTACN
ncbi:MAG: rRNA pseudouridine synthase [Oscillospiraceae bacterium]|nr:rRNA pseudouridine synthase [Oscillospiraceae bacterium]